MRILWLLLCDSCKRSKARPLVLKMGVYPGKIYGVSLSSDIKQYEIIFDNMTTQIQNVKDFYDALSINERLGLNIRFYTSCSSTYGSEKGEFMLWVPGSISMLERLFDGLNDPSKSIGR